MDGRLARVARFFCESLLFFASKFFQKMAYSFSKKMALAACLSALLAVAFGAFGAHMLRERLTPTQLHTWETAVFYQFIHALALLFLSLFSEKTGDEKLIRWAGWCWVAGICCFSGSLYLLACRDFLSLPLGILGPITPVGGLLFMAGWGMLAWRVFKNS